MMERMQTRFDTLQIEGFRRLKQLDLELRPFTVLIGANGVGKTSLLDAWTLLARSARGELVQAVADLHGLAALRSGGEAETISLRSSMSVAGREPINYRLSLAVQGTGYDIANEDLSQVQRGPGFPPFKFLTVDGGNIRYSDPKTKKLTKPDWETKPGQTALSQVPPMYTEPERYRKALASSTFYHALDVGPRAPVRLPQPMRPAELPGINGEDLISCLYSLRESHRDRYEAVEDALRAGFPGFERLEFPPVAAGTLALAWRDKNFRHPLYTHQLSEGTLRFLWLITLLQSPGLTEVTLIDEPEVSLHPELLSLLVDLLREASSRTQIIVATHADRFVRFLEPREVVAMDIDEEGWTKATWGDDLDLEKWLGEYSLDQLWSMGDLGGRSS